MSDSEEVALSRLSKPAAVKEEEEAPLALLERKKKRKKKQLTKDDRKKQRTKDDKKVKKDDKEVKKDDKEVKKDDEKVKKDEKKEKKDVKEVKKDEKKVKKDDKKVKKKRKTTTVKDEDTPLAEVKAENGNGVEGGPVNGTENGNGDGKREPSEETAAKDEDRYKWWEDEKFGQGPERWQTLQHNGVIFPPAYEPLPSYVKLYYAGRPVDLLPAAEEVAGFFAAMLETDHAKNPVFQKNFFEDFVRIYERTGGKGIKHFSECDFSKMHAFFEKQREEKKNLTKAEKKALKDERDRVEAPFKTCMVNGRKEDVGNFRVEPPGLFRGRGAHPKTGKVKRRIYPEDITLNLGAEAPVPKAPEGHSWGAVRHDKTVVWLAMWKENISEAFKYVKLAANSSIKGVSDMKKFETARQLKNHIGRIREDYNKLLKDKYMQNRQIATATYLIDVFALRAGGEKGDDEADTVGCCSLRYEHVSLKPPNTVIFDFLGKDSIRFYQEVEVDRQVFRNLRIFKKEPKQPGDDLFDRITPATLNRHLQDYMKGLTAKVFRTYNASKTMQDQMDLIANEGTVAEKVLKYNAANRTVAILCNHQRTVAKSHQLTVEKINDRIKEMEWQKLRLKKMILHLDETQRTTDPKYFAEIEDMPKELLLEVVHDHIEKVKDQAKKKWYRDNEKRALENMKPLTEADLEEKLRQAEEALEAYLKEVHSGVVWAQHGATVGKLRSQVEKIEARITNTSLQLKDKEDNSEVSLGTSKLNYIDPRLTVMFSKKFGVPMEKLFTKTLRDKFNWAIESADENWRF